MSRKLLLTADEKREHDRKRWKENARRQKVRALSEHRALVAELGGVCVEAGCGARERLEVDHVDGRLWRVEDLGFAQRVQRYWAEYRAGVRLQVKCRKHNWTDGGTKRYVKCSEGKRVASVVRGDVNESEPLANEVVEKEIDGVPF